MPAASATIEAPEQTPLIQGGQAAASCEWPTSVALFNGMGMCSGTLVHPRVVTSAAHCFHPMNGGYPDSVRFGEETFNPAFQVAVDYCLYNPGWNGQVGETDYAFCVLSAAVELPPTPPLMGCELELLEPGVEVALVGFGNDSDNGGAGTKRWGDSVIVGTQQGVQDGIIAAGTMNLSSCQGDSGGTGYIQLADGGWRSWGMLSGGPEGCGNEGYYVSIAHAAAWIEAESGYDITPCHDVDGTWNPGPACTGAATNPIAGGTWNQGCVGEVGEEPATCGPGISWPDDVTPPLVSFTIPTDGEVFVDSPANFDITVDTQDEGFAVLSVELFVDGQSVATRDRLAWAPYEPWVFSNAEFFDGSYELRAVATDYDGNVGESTIMFHVGEAPGDGDGDPATGDGDGDPGGGETETSGGEAETGGEDSGTGGPAIMPIADEGCGCASSPGGRGGLGAVLALGLLALIRRRRA